MNRHTKPWGEPLYVDCPGPRTSGIFNTCVNLLTCLDTIHVLFTHAFVLLVLISANEIKKLVDQSPDQLADLHCMSINIHVYVIIFGF